MNVNYIWTVDTAVTEAGAFHRIAQQRFRHSIAASGFQWRPFLTENVIVTAGVGFLVPGQGYKDIYRANTEPVRVSGAARGRCG